MRLLPSPHSLPRERPLIQRFLILRIPSQQVGTIYFGVAV